MSETIEELQQELAEWERLCASNTQEPHRLQCNLLIAVCERLDEVADLLKQIRDEQ